jgi:thiol-disulfide isomerase/thioredoxin
MLLRVTIATLLCIALNACNKTEPAPNRTSQLLQGAQGRWVLVNYWAEWCKPCIAEIPELNQFQRRFGATAVVYMVNFDGIQGEQLRQQAARLGIEVPLLETDPAAELGLARPAALPSTFVFGPDGTLQQTLHGQQSLDALAAAIGQSAAAATP